MITDPYATPTTIPYGGESSFPPGLVSVAAVQQLAATKPWVMFISIMTFIGAGFTLLAALGMFFAGFAMNTADMSKATQSNPAFGIFGFAGLGAIYVVLAFGYIYAGVKLWKYASAIGSLLQTGSEADLVAALNQQRSFWKFVGILTIIMIVISLVSIVGVAVAAGVAAASHAH